jgi:hypothetical protein
MSDRAEAAHDGLPLVPTVLGIFALVLSCGAWWELMRQPVLTSEYPRVLVYDELALPNQVRPYVEAGHDQNEIVTLAFSRAIEQGYLILRRSPDLKGVRRQIIWDI